MHYVVNVPSLIFTFRLLKNSVHIKIWIVWLYVHWVGYAYVRWCLGGTTAIRSQQWLTEPFWWTITPGTTRTFRGWAKRWPAPRTRLMRSWGNSTSITSSSSSEASLATRLTVGFWIHFCYLWTNETIFFYDSWTQSPSCGQWRIVD